MGMIILIQSYQANTPIKILISHFSQNNHLYFWRLPDEHFHRDALNFDARDALNFEIEDLGGCV